MLDVPVVPAPVRAERREGAPFVLRRGVRVLVGHEPAVVSLGVVAASDIGRRLAAPVALLREDDGRPGIVELALVTDPAEMGTPPDLAPARAVEAYRIDVTAARITLSALDGLGLLRALASLDQLARHNAAGDVSFAPMTVWDHPRYAWRGLCLDLARHFFDVATIKSVVAVLAGLKLNVLHLHLTDDQGWRIHLTSRPRLTEVSGSTAVGGDRGGFLTTDQYAEVVAYAQSLGVTVVPEIDIPGHVNAALHAYGELSPSGNPAPPYTGVGVGFSRLDGQLPATAEFLRAVFGEIAAMTPGPYVHLGGDEALTMHAAEYDQLVTIAAETLRGAGKTVVGWQEAARTTLPPGSVLQLWDDAGDRADADVVFAAVTSGARIVLTPAARAYFDTRHDDASPVGRDWTRTTLRDAYEWEPADVLAVPEDQLLGVEAAVWTETIRTPRELFLMLLPRLAALADAAWADPEQRTWEGFAEHLQRLTARWDELGVPWYRAALETAT